jgi:hypothetical protein
MLFSFAWVLARDRGVQRTEVGNEDEDEDDWGGDRDPGQNEKTGLFSLMKSAYELAMERLEKQSPSSKLTDDQRSQLAEIDSLYKSKIAERELLLTDEIRRERAAGKAAEVEKLQHQLASELRRLTEECESKKENIRKSSG